MQRLPVRFAARGMAAMLALPWFLCGAWASATTDLAPSQEAPQQTPREDAGPRLVFRDRITPHWSSNSTRFWYRNDLRGGAKEFIVVDAERGLRTPAFDHAKVAQALAQASGTEIAADRLPFDHIEFLDQDQAIRFKAHDADWRCDLQTYDCAKADPSEEPVQADAESTRERRSRRRPAGGSGGEEAGRSPAPSPDGQWTALVRDHNIVLKPTKEGAAEVQLSTDGQEGLAYDRLWWSPDSKTVVAFRVASAARKEVHLVQSSPTDGGRAKLTSRPYALPGDAFTTYEPNLFDVASLRQIKPDVDRFEHEWLRPRLRWNREGTRVTYNQTDRGHQRFRVIELEAATGTVRNLVDEKTDTFIWTAHTENLSLETVTWLANSDEFIYASESNGWRHLYLVDAAVGKLKHAITSGSWVVRGIDHIDETNRLVWFQACGVFPGQDPYLIHYGRAGLDGGGLVWLTAGDGSHSVQFSPDRRFIIDTYSRVDLAPVHELRRTSDGALVCRLEEADTRALEESGESGGLQPEVFAAKGRDGLTDIWGVIHRPNVMDPGKKYPVIEDIYAGPQSSYVPKTFSARARYGSLTSQGFFVVKIDGMGTANRSKAFHDVCWKNLKDAGFEDRILWMKAAAAKHPAMDLRRVGVYGTSAGGQSAAGALLFHPEFYKVAVANCGCHDNRMDKASWNEQWMGYPVGAHYGENSNIDHAHRLRGKLMLVVGEMDNNVPPESTYRLVDALIRAGKDFDFLMIPNGGHGAGGTYGARRRDDFFVRHLQGREPPDRNASP